MLIKAKSKAHIPSKAFVEVEGKTFTIVMSIEGLEGCCPLECYGKGNEIIMAKEVRWLSMERKGGSHDEERERMKEKG